MKIEKRSKEKERERWLKREEKRQRWREYEKVKRDRKRGKKTTRGRGREKERFFLHGMALRNGEKEVFL